MPKHLKVCVAVLCWNAIISTDNQGVTAALVSGTFTGTVDSIAEFEPGALPPGIALGDAVAASFAYDPDDATEVILDPWLSVYSFSPTGPSNFLEITIGPHTWRTGSGPDSFIAEVVNDAPPPFPLTEPLTDSFTLFARDPFASFPAAVDSSGIQFTLNGTVDMLGSTQLPTDTADIDITQVTSSGGPITTFRRVSPVQLNAVYGIGYAITLDSLSIQQVPEHSSFKLWGTGMLAQLATVCSGDAFPKMPRSRYCDADRTRSTGRRKLQFQGT